MSLKSPAALEPASTESPQQPQQDSSKPRRRGWLWLFVVLILGLAGYGLLQRQRNTQAPQTGLTGRSVPQRVPVAVATVRKGEIPVYLNGLGSVAAFNIVTVRSRVDGQLIRVAFREGQFVNAGDLLAEIDPRPYEVQLAQAEGQLARDQAQLNNARVDFVRYENLFKEGLIPKQQLDSQGAMVGQIQGSIKADEAQIADARLQLSYCRITAPISGRVGLRMVDAGNMVRASDQNGLLVITQVQPISVLFTIPEDNLPPVLKRLRGGAPPLVEAYDRGGKTKIATGHLLTVDNQIDPNTGTSRLKAVFDNRDNTLFPNQFVNARLLLDVRKGALLLPTVAIQRGPQGTFVYLVKEGETVEVRPVTIGLTEGSDTSVESGLSAGETVVVDGMDKLQAGSKVRIQPANRDRTGRGPGA
jgi:membrane fusion protein, multidrug efflux system